ncbi:basic amino acid/polyamine antiporter [Neobacillus drentensis]|uniref:basic amino acid/polyamine antiporter n=1 Tax=Neobacillus drentensis TaxID=220684 RepID=UPI001F33B114|nr:basic amino acid/polyamine antiporter [Neobacillus drentensis]ULT57043.1 basic amino acid/polyamine antiporter [Neobacillus drentensis]
MAANSAKSMPKNIEESQTKAAGKKLGLMALIALGVGSMIGGGVFNSPTDLINVANPQSVILAWVVGGIGVIGLALIFQLLANKRPELAGGIASYAREGFGDLLGFLSAFGYWVSGLFGNVAFFTLLIKTLNSLLPTSHQIPPIASFILASVILWAVVYLQTKGQAQVGFINLIVTIAKLLPLALVILLGIFVFHPVNFNVPNWTSVLAKATAPVTAASLGHQINSAMGVILWCFIGVEASSILAEKAESQKIVGKATVIAIIVTLIVYMAISAVSMGVIPAHQLASASTPLADVLGATVIGSAGAVIVKLGIIISLLGALLTWIMIAAQLPYVAAKEGLLPKAFTKTNKNGAPTFALFITNGIAQVFFLVLLSKGLQNIYNMVLLLATTCIILPYLLSALYAFKVSMKDKLGAGAFISSVIAIIYTVYCYISVGLVFLAASFIIYAIGMFVFYKTKKDNGKVISKAEWFWMAVIFIIGVVMAILLATGAIAF